MAKTYKSTKDKVIEAVIIAALIVALVLGVITIVAWIYALVVYGNTPVTQLPTWAWWLLQKGGRR